LDWDGRVTFVLSDTLQLKKVAFADDVLEQAKAQGQRADDFDGSVLMLTAEIGPLINDLIDALDGLQEVGVASPASAAPTTSDPAAPAAATSLQAPGSAGRTPSEDDDPPF
jgi:recombination associated protein RdgC